MRVSDKGLAEIAAHEGIVLSRYKDSVGVWTIGIGHTASAGRPNPAKVQGPLPLSEIMSMFRRDIRKFEKRVVRAFSRPLTQAQFDAAVSFDYNTGAIHRASWVRHFNRGNLQASRNTFMNWSKPEEIIPRRKKERDLFFDGAYSGEPVTLYKASASGRVLWGSGRKVDLLAHLRPGKPIQQQKQSPKAAPAGKVGAGVAATGGIITALTLLWDEITAWIGGLF